MPKNIFSDNSNDDLLTEVFEVNRSYRKTRFLQFLKFQIKLFKHKLLQMIKAVKKLSPKKLVAVTTLNLALCLMFTIFISSMTSKQSVSNNSAPAGNNTSLNQNVDQSQSQKGNDKAPMDQQKQSNAETPLPTSSSTKIPANQQNRYWYQEILVDVFNYINHNFVLLFLALQAVFLYLLIKIGK